MLLSVRTIEQCEFTSHESKSILYTYNVNYVHNLITADQLTNQETCIHRMRLTTRQHGRQLNKNNKRFGITKLVNKCSMLLRIKLSGDE